MSASSSGRLESDMAISVTMQDPLTRSHAPRGNAFCTLRVPSVGLDAERPEGRSHGDRGNEKRECDSTRVESSNGVNRHRE